MALRLVMQPNSRVRHRIRLLTARLNLAVPPALRSRWCVPTPEGRRELRDYITAQYLPNWYEGTDIQSFLDSEEGRHDLKMHLEDRLHLDRYQFVPWINNVLPLAGASVLEIGCGTGSAVLSVAEQGASVTAIDVDDRAVEATRVRCRAYGVGCTALVANAQGLSDLFAVGDFDLIVFFAVLEHMTLAERQESLRAAWSLLKPGQYLCITDTPNRLWPYDSHTSRLPFFHWLPDELAFAYSSRSLRSPFNAKYRERSDAAMLDFVRQGRGVSYHEVDIAIGALRIVSDQTDYLRVRNPLKLIKRVIENDIGKERWLNQFAPDRHRCWFRQSLNIVVRKGP